MLVKSLILGLILAGAAGTIVYYGTAPQGSVALETAASNGAAVEKSVKKERDRIEPRLPTIRKAADTDERQKLASAGGLPVADAEASAQAEDMRPIEMDAEPKKQTRWLDQYLKNNKGAKTDKADEPEAEDAANDGGSDMAVSRYTVTERAAIEDIEPEVMPEDVPSKMTKEDKKSVTDPRHFYIKDGKLVENDAADDVADPDDIAQMEEAQKTSEIHDKMMAEHDAKKPMEHKFTNEVSSMANDTSPLLSTVMREAAQIKKPELRDQAYFEITEYALSEGRFDSARMAHDMITQDELSYTAKSRIAVAFAQNGQPTKAFKVIEEVNEAELRDFMRLQVIEALIAPERLPATWQENKN